MLLIAAFDCPPLAAHPSTYARTNMLGVFLLLRSRSSVSSAIYMPALISYNSVMIGPPTERACTPERARGDAELIEALNAVTNWRREGDFVRLIGPKTLRFRVPTN